MGKRLGDWEIQRDLSEGGQGWTHIVHKIADTAPFVMKRLKNKTRLHRFQREIDVGLKLSHPNIVKVVAYDLENNDPYFVSEYYPGGSLQELAVEAFSLVEKLQMFHAICLGVGEAHLSQVIHRDLKPLNIFLKSDLSPVVGDFGLCLLLDDEKRLTQDSEVIGGRFFVAPEHEDGRFEDASAQSDLYSLGKILYWLCSDKEIFNREKHREGKWDLTARDSGSAIRLIYEVLDGTIVADPDKRQYHDALDLASSIEDVIRRVQMQAHAIGSKHPQLCSYCGKGTYQKLLHEPAKPSGRANLGNKSHDMAIQFINTGTPIVWLVMACDYCGNVQWFRPDKAKDTKIWD